MNFIDAVRSACRAALRNDDARLEHAEWQIIYRRRESVSEFVARARALGYDARDEGDGTIVVYSSEDRPVG